MFALLTGRLAQNDRVRCAKRLEFIDSSISPEWSLSKSVQVTQSEMEYSPSFRTRFNFMERTC